jgi:hypothetical protein
VVVVVAVSLHSAAGMSEAMMREAREKTDFWQHLDYSAIRAQRGGATAAAAAAGDGDDDDDDGDDGAGRARARVSTACSSGSAGGFACSNVDLQSFLTLEDIGCGYESLTFTHSLTHTYTHTYIHTYSHTYIHSHIYSLTNTLTRSLTHTYTHSHTNTLTHTFTHSIIQSLPSTDSLNNLIHMRNRLRTHPLIVVCL